MIAARLTSENDGQDSKGEKGRTNVVEDIPERRDVRQRVAVGTNEGCHRDRGRYDKIVCSPLLAEGLQEGKEVRSVILRYDVATKSLSSRVLPAVIRMSEQDSTKKWKGSALKFNPIQFVLRDGHHDCLSKGGTICLGSYGRGEV